MPTLKADNKLRELCLVQEGTILLVDAGVQDKVIRILPLPSVAARIREEQFERSGVKKNHVVLDMNRGPHQEAWGEIKRAIFIGAPRDRAMPEPKNAAEKPGDPWELSPEDVPVVKLQGYDKPEEVTIAAVDPAKPGEVPLLDAAAANQTKKKSFELLKCDEPGCVVSCKGAFGMKQHKRKAHPKG